MRTIENVLIDGQQFIIRNLTGSDYNTPEKFADYLNRIIDDPRGMILAKRKKTVDMERAWLKDMLAEIATSRAAIIIAELDNLVIGMAGAHLRPERAEHVAELGVSVLKEYRGRGLGSLLFKKALQAAETKLFPRPRMVRLSVFNINKEAISMYKKHDFEIVAHIPEQFEFNGQYVDEIIMLRPID